MPLHTIFLVVAGDTAEHRPALYAGGCRDAFVSPADQRAHCRFERDAPTALDAMSAVIRHVESDPGLTVVMVENDEQPAAAIINSALQLRARCIDLRPSERQTLSRLGLRDVLVAPIEANDAPPAVVRRFRLPRRRHAEPSTGR